MIALKRILVPYDFSETSAAAVRYGTALARNFPEFAVRPGAPAAEVVRYAQEAEIDLIVMGTHGRGFVGHVVMGSVAEKVVRTAPCPVLTVRNPNHGFLVPDAVKTSVAAAV